MNHQWINPGHVHRCDFATWSQIWNKFCLFKTLCACLHLTPDQLHAFFFCDQISFVFGVIKFYLNLIDFIDFDFFSLSIQQEEELDKELHRSDKKVSEQLIDCRVNWNEIFKNLIQINQIDRSRSQQDTVLATNRLRKEQKMRQKLAKQSHSIFNPECAFHLLLGGGGGGAGEVGAGGGIAASTSSNGYDSDSSYVIRRREQSMWGLSKWQSFFSIAP